MNKLKDAKRKLELIEGEARLLATTRMTTDAVAERAVRLLMEVQAARIAVAEAENELLKMKYVGGDE